LYRSKKYNGGINDKRYSNDKKENETAAEQLQRKQKRFEDDRNAIKKAKEQRSRIRQVMIEIFSIDFVRFWKKAQEKKKNNDLNSKIGATYAFEWALAKHIGQCLGMISTEVLSVGMIVLIVILCLIALFGIAFAIWYFGFREKRDDDLDNINDEEE